MELPPLGVDKNLPILKKNRATTGIRELDIILEGGYQSPANILIVGSSSVEKNAFAFHFIAEGLRSKRDAVIVIATDGAPQSIRDKATSVGIDLQGEIYFIDCYSATVGLPTPEGNKLLSYVPGPSALEDLSVAIKEAITKNAGKRIRVVFYSLSSLLLYNPKDSITRFIQVVGGRLKNAGATSLMLVEEGVHDKQLLSTIEHIVDDRLYIHDRGGTLDLELPSLSVSVPIKLGPNGINVI